MVDFTRGTPIALSDGTPVTLFQKSMNIFTRWRYLCFVHTPFQTRLETFDSGGANMKGGPRCGNVPKQSRWEVRDPKGYVTTFYVQSLAEAFVKNAKTAAGKQQPGWTITEVITGDEGRNLGSKVILTTK